jgi:hypothetical protein
MKKKTVKKLELSKETVRSLEPLNKILGGTAYPITDHSCDVFCQAGPLTERCA